MTVKELIAKKQSEKNPKHLELDDVNRNLIISLFAVSVYGKPARDEDVLKIIIGGPKMAKGFAKDMERAKEEYLERKKTMKITRKKGVMYDQNGFYVIAPKGT